MKFEINKDKLEQVIFKYLDNKNFIVKETSDNYYFLENEEPDYAKIKVVKESMTCFISYRLDEEIRSFFSLKTSNVKDIITRYVENKLNIEIFETGVIFKSFDSKLKTIN